MLLRLKYFIEMYVLFINFLIDNKIKDEFKHVVKKVHLLIWVLGKTPNNYMNHEEWKRKQPSFVDKWLAHLLLDDNYYIYIFLLFLKDNDATDNFRKAINNSYEWISGIENYITIRNSNRFILDLNKHISNPDEHKYWWDMNIKWKKYLKEINK